MPRPKTNREKLTLRLPPDVHVLVKNAAAENDRSLNAEIIARLRSSLVGYQQDYVSQRVRS